MVHTFIALHNNPDLRTDTFVDQLLTFNLVSGYPSDLIAHRKTHQVEAVGRPF